MVGKSGQASLKAKTRSERDFGMRLCYTPKTFSCLEENKIQYKPLFRACSKLSENI